MIEFLKRCIDYFISFTSQVYNLRYINEYQPKTEMIAAMDDVGIVITNTQIDSVFLDENVSVFVEEGDEFDETQDNNIGEITLSDDYIKHGDIYVFKYSFCKL